jgi:hypothetical protein
MGAYLPLVSTAYYLSYAIERLHSSLHLLRLSVGFYYMDSWKGRLGLCAWV